MTLYEYRQRWGLKEAVTNREFRGVREDLDKFALASYFAEVTEQLTPEQLPAPEPAGAAAECPLRPGEVRPASGAGESGL